MQYYLMIIVFTDIKLVCFFVPCQPVNHGALLRADPCSTHQSSRVSLNGPISIMPVANGVTAVVTSVVSLR